MTMTEWTVQTIESYGRLGLIVSIVFADCGNKGCLWSVSVMDPMTGKEFKRPFITHDFETIAGILNNEVPKMTAII